MGRARIIADLVGFSTDSGVLNFGADKEITLTHDPDDGLILKHAATADDSFPELTFQTGDTDIAVNDLLGRINFQAPDEAAGTDAILVAGAIAAISEGDFSSSANATSLIFQTGASETATTKMTLSSGGNLDVTGALTTGGILKTDDTTAATSTTDGSLQTDGGLSVAADAVIGDDLLLLSDAAVLNFGADSEIKLTHVHNTGLLLTDSGGTPTLQFHDANESFASDGSKIIMTSGGTTFNMPSSDGSNGQALATDGSGTLSFVSVAANTPSSADAQALGSASLEWSDLFLADAGTIQFGNDQDVILTHVADTGLLLSGTNVIQFNDASQNIGAPSNAILDINATDEIELNATLVDVNANLDVSGTITSGGVITGTAFTAGSAVLAEAELELLDGLTAGTAIASKVVTTDANIDSTGMRNLTISGEIDAATGDFSGAVDVAGATTVVALTASGLVTAGAKIDLNGTELILDADADTSITADTDDKIDFRIGGADVMQMNATAFSGGAIYENADDIAANYSITAGKNAMSVGPITIADSVTVTVPSGQRWVIL